MEIIIVILLIIIVLIITYLFLIKRDLKRINKELKNTLNSDSNITIHKELGTKELQSLIQEINNLIKENKQAKIDFENKYKELRKMIINISHDLRTPLTSALGYIDILLTSDLDKENSKEELLIIEGRLRQLEELINSFFLFSKTVSGNIKISLEEINLIAILEECIVHYYDDFKNENRKIILNSNLSNYKMVSNKEMLMRIFDNLIGNAYKHSKSNLEIAIKKNKRIEINFSNNLDNYDLDITHIFDEFYTMDISRTKGNTGLGLAIAKEFTEQLGGTISAKIIESKLNILIEI